MQKHNPFLDEFENDQVLQPDTVSNEQRNQLNYKNLSQDENLENYDGLMPQLIEDLSEAPELVEAPSTQTSSQLTVNENDSSEIKMEDLVAIAKHGMDSNRLFEVMKEGIETAMVQGPKGDLLPDWKSRAQLIQSFMRATGRFKADTVINVMNLFGKVDTGDSSNIY